MAPCRRGATGSALTHERSVTPLCRHGDRLRNPHVDEHRLVVRTGEFGEQAWRGVVEVCRVELRVGQMCGIGNAVVVPIDGGEYTALAFGSATDVDQRSMNNRSQAGEYCATAAQVFGRFKFVTARP